MGHRRFGGELLVGFENGLVGPHRIEIDIGSQPKDVEDVIEHLPMLPPAEEDRLEPGAGAKLSNHGGHLDRLGASPDDHEDTFHQKPPIATAMPRSNPIP
jgi:hypothetical protein